MSTRTITITDPAKVQVADVATFTSRSGTVIGTVLGIKPFEGFGDGRDGQPGVFKVAAFTFEHDFHVDYFASATRELPEVLPGTAGTATVRGEPLQTVMRCQSSDGDFWTTPSPVSGARQHLDGLVTDFVPYAAGGQLAEGLVDRDPADYGDAPDDAPADSTVCVRCGRVALHHSAGRYSQFGVCPVTKVPSRDQLADAMHDDNLPTGHPRLTGLQRLILADAVGELLRKGGA